MISTYFPGSDHKLSKFETLQMAQTYIGALANLLDRANKSKLGQGDSLNQATMEAVQLLTQKASKSQNHLDDSSILG